MPKKCPTPGKQQFASRGEAYNYCKNQQRGRRYIIYSCKCGCHHLTSKKG